jgi:class 3 adenylate cyclase/streptogramin lyase
MTGPAGTRGFLFADLRGYTRFVESRGDAAGADLLRRYRDLTREVVAAYDGAEIRTEGDGVYVVFGSVTAAVDAGLDLVDRAAEASRDEPDRPIRVAVGIHAGETSSSDEGPVGSAVNIAARVCAKAEAGEVLVTGTVRSLVRTARPYRATALGSQHLKGVAEAIPLFRLERTASPTTARLRRQAGARRGRLAFAGLGIAGLLVLAGAAWAANRPADCLGLSSATRDVVVRIDPERACVVQAIPVGARPGPIVATDDAVWVASQDDLVLHKIDLDGTIGATLGLRGQTVDLATSPSGDVWVLGSEDRLLGDIETAGSVARVDGDAARLRHAYLLPRDFLASIGGGWSGIAYLGESAWVTRRASGRVERIRIMGPSDSSTVTLRSPLPTGSGPVEAIAGAIWVGDAGEPMIYRVVDVDTGWTAHPLDAHGGTTAMASDGAILWLAREDGWLTRFDPATKRSLSFEADASPTAPAVDGESVWFIERSGESVRRLDVPTERMDSVPVGGIPGGIAVGTRGDVWVTVRSP